MSLSSHIKIKPEKQRIQLHNTDHKVAEGIYVAGTLAGWRSHFYCGQWRRSSHRYPYSLNNGIQTHIHDSIR
jgi:hypothetical protein